MNKDFQKEFISAVKKTEIYIEKFLPEENGFQKTCIEAMNYSVQSGGKRIRPLMILKTFEMLSSPGRREEMMPLVHAFMAAMEYIHTFSLVHDDLPAMDGDKMRRGRPSCWYKFGEAEGVLSGDGLSLYAFEIINKEALKLELDKEEYRDIILSQKILSQKAGIYGMLGGQALDVELTGNKPSKDELEFIYENKTGALLEACFMIGAVLAGRSDLLDDMEKTGSLLGLAFQIRDDILDITGDEKKLGKPVGSDEENKKITYVTIYGMENAERSVKSLSLEAEERLSMAGKEIASQNEEAFSALEFLRELIKALINRTS